MLTSGILEKTRNWALSSTLSLSIPHRQGSCHPVTSKDGGAVRTQQSTGSCQLHLKLEQVNPGKSQGNGVVITVGKARI